MISDEWDRVAQYNMGEIGQEIVEFVEKVRKDINLQTLPSEPVNLSHCKAYFSSYMARDFADGHYEYHKKMADFQILLQGQEKIYLYPLKLLTVKQDFDSNKDIGFCNEKPDPELIVSISPQRFALILPHEAHFPSIKINDDSASIVKLVIKVPYKFLNIGE